MAKKVTKVTVEEPKEVKVVKKVDEINAADYNCECDFGLKFGEVCPICNGTGKR